MDREQIKNQVEYLFDKYEDDDVLIEMLTNCILVNYNKGFDDGYSEGVRQGETKHY